MCLIHGVALFAIPVEALFTDARFGPPWLAWILASAATASAAFCVVRSVSLSSLMERSTSRR